MLHQQWQQIQVRQLSEARRKLGILSPEVRTWFVATANALITNTTSETSLFGTGVGTRTFPANTFKVGTCIRIRILGTHTMDPTPPDIIFRVKLGSTTLAQVNYTDLNDTDRIFELDFIATIRQIGAAGSVIGQGRILMAELTDTCEIYELVMTSPAAIDTTAALTVDVTGEPDAADANSNITITNSFVAII